MSDVRIYVGEYGGWSHCVFMENEKIRVVITTDVGPRIICCQTLNGENLFYRFPEQQGRIGDAEWHNYGGHRLWHSPQEGLRPNQPDNTSVVWNQLSENSIEFIAPEESATKVQKNIKVTIDNEKPSVVVEHSITNKGMWPIDLAPWALSVMQQKGLEVLPVPRNDTYYLPNFAVSFWPWTRPNDPRFTWGEKYFMLRHDPDISTWFKIGYHNNEGWGAYFFSNTMFVKYAPPIKGKVYPDYDSTFETYADEFFIELESLGALEHIKPGESAVHTEKWFVVDNIKEPESEEDFIARIEPVIQTLIK